MSTAVPSFTADIALSERHIPNPAKPVPERKKRVAVTGGSGKLGRWVVRELVEHGWQVWNLDIIGPAASEADVKANHVLVDLSDYGQVLGCLADLDGQFRKLDAVIHLSAIPAPGKAPNARVFQTNILQTYNILEACRVIGISNVACASSETVLGIPMFPHLPESLPLKEDIEMPESSYSLSKLMGEKMADQFARWNPEAKIVSIRLSNVIAPAEYERFLTWQDDPWVRVWNFWAYIDARDCAQAFRLAIESTSLTGHHIFNIANADSVHTTPTAQLLERVAPSVKFTPETNDPREGLISIKKAREMLGYEPRYDWQSQIKAAAHK